MAFEVKIPPMGESVTEAVIGRWIKQDGDPVAADEPVLELESDKANMELAAEKPGVLHILRAAGETVKEGDVVGLIEESDGRRTAVKAAAGSGAQATRAAAPVADTGGPAIGPGQSPAAPANDPHAAPPPGERAPASVAAEAATARADERPLSPAVRRIVRESGLEASEIPGTGPGGRITKQDALAVTAERRDRTPQALDETPPRRAAADGAAALATASPPRLAAVSVVAAPARAPASRSDGHARGEEAVPMSRLRQVIARRLVEAQHAAAILTTFNEADMSAIQDLRARYKESFQKRHGVGLGFMSFFVKACCEAIVEVPEINAEIRGTDIVYKHHVHMGVAVSTERGLVVPVVRDADQRSFADIESEILRLAGLARDNRLSVDDLSGATFTISNGGIYGSLLSTPILNPPQSGILGMHKIEKRPVVIDDQIAIRPMMYLALSYDHRIVDGRGAVTFLVKVKEGLEDPTRLLLGL